MRATFCRSLERVEPVRLSQHSEAAAVCNRVSLGLGCRLGAFTVEGTLTVEVSSPVIL